MKYILKNLAITMIFILVIWSEISFGIEIGALQEMLDQGDPVTIIDIRSQELYKQSHIRTAINIPAAILDRKPLPPIGTVVVCGNGVRSDITLKAVEQLNAKPGIEAEILEGGFAAWQTRNLPRTQTPGMTEERLRYITFQELQKSLIGNSNIVLADIRQSPTSERRTGQNPAAGNRQTLTNLSEMFPDISIISDDSQSSSRIARNISGSSLSTVNRKHHDRVYVLIDNGDGRSEKVARRLYGAGIKQVVILVGGEKILQRDGQTDSRTNVSGESL